MNAISVFEASNNLMGIIESTIQNSDTTIITSDKGSVVMVGTRYWEEMQETLRLLQDKRSLKALLKGHKHRMLGQPMVAKTTAEVFYDLQN